MKISVKTRAQSPFRRAGLVFGPAPLELDTDELGADRTAAIRGEAMLEVADLSAAAPPPAVAVADADAGQPKRGRR